MGKFVLHTVQLLPKTVVRAFEHHKMFSLGEEGEFVYSFPVKELQVLEVCLAKWWAHIGTVEVDYTITFHGLSLEGSMGTKELTLVSSEGITRLDVASRIHAEEVRKLRKNIRCFNQPFHLLVHASCKSYWALD